MKLSEFKYDLPKGAIIAQEPANPRDSSKLMIYNKETKKYEHKIFRDIINYFQKGDCIVVNDTRVFPARLWGTKEKTNAEIEVMLLRELRSTEKIWDVLVEPARKVRIGNKIYFDNSRFYCEVIDNTTSRGRTVRFGLEGDLFDEIDAIGFMPIPDYIKRTATEADKKSYQSVFADLSRQPASIAPPTASLHFTDELVEQLVQKGVKFATVTVNIGQGIFESIGVEDLTKHSMHSEYFEINLKNAEIINKSLKSGKRVCAVGASVVRALESSVLVSGTVKANKGWTDRFVFPPSEFKIANMYITNFTPSASPSLLLTAAFLEDNLIPEIMKIAFEKKYRLYAYGDAMLIL